MTAKILLVDDDPTILQLLKLFLENEGYQVLAAQSGPAGLEIASAHLPDLAIVDIMMPIMDGFETCQRLREIGMKAILAMSHRHDERSVVKALDSGADDYLRKPFEVPVLAARIRTLLRRDNLDLPEPAGVYNDGHLLIDLDRRHVRVRGKSVQLTPTEFRLLSTLLRNLGRVVSHEELLREVWGMEDNASLVSLKVYVHYLRQKIEDHPRRPQYLLAEWGVGYRFREPTPVLRGVN
ncbi:MAG: response regulator transcription factor [Anaerolineales bacterium]|nr:MAG: response regulator transcription factor [Anaerolineales bacterium]